MERTTHRRRIRRRPKKIRLMVYGFAAAAVFTAGIIVGGMLRQEGRAEDLPAGLIQREGGVGAVKQGVIDAGFIDQREKYPTGCESVSAVMALQYAGIDVSVEEFIDSYLPRGEEPYRTEGGVYYTCDPNRAFMGDPYSQDGWGCYSPVIQSAAERLLADRSSSLKVENLDGMELGKIVEDYIDQGVPVILWATMYMEPPQVGAVMTIEGTGERLDWITPEHCLLLVGADGDQYYFNDPLAGKAVAYEKRSVETAYRAQGRQALAIL